MVKVRETKNHDIISDAEVHVRFSENALIAPKQGT